MQSVARHKFKVTRLIFICIAAAAISAVAVSRNRCADMDCLVNPYFSGFVRYRQKESADFFSSSDYRKGTVLAHIRSEIVQNRPDASVIARQYASDVRNMYDVLRAPYPGQFSASVICDRTYMPKIIQPASGSVLVAMRGMMSINGSFGVCDAAETGHPGLVELVYCDRSRRLYTVSVEQFSPGADTLPEVLEISCSTGTPW